MGEDEEPGLKSCREYAGGGLNAKSKQKKRGKLFKLKENLRFETKYNIYMCVYYLYCTKRQEKEVIEGPGNYFTEIKSRKKELVYVEKAHRNQGSSPIAIRF